MCVHCTPEQDNVHCTNEREQVYKGGGGICSISRLTLGSCLSYPFLNYYLNSIHKSNVVVLLLLLLLFCGFFYNLSMCVNQLGMPRMFVQVVARYLALDGCLLSGYMANIILLGYQKFNKIDILLE